MKKLLAIVLALVMVLSLAACGSDKTPATEAPTEAPTEAETPTEEPAVDGIETPDTPIEEEPDAPVEQPAAEGATAILDAIWALHGEDQKFPALGGDGGNPVDGAPGKMDHTAESMQYQLQVPVELMGQIDDAAGLFNAMMVNNFSAGAFHVTGDAKTFAESLYNGVIGTNWMCGFPEKIQVAVIGEYVVMVYGLSEFVDNFAAHMATAYPEVEVLYNEAIEG